MRAFAAGFVFAVLAACSASGDVGPSRAGEPGSDTASMAAPSPTAELGPAAPGGAADEQDGRDDTFAVSVVGGYGSGRYRPGSTVHVWSAASTTDQVVEPWVGDADLLEDPDEWHTSFVMPHRDVTLEAVSSDQRVQVRTETFQGATAVDKRVRYAFPPTMRGVVLFSHGTGGSDAFLESTEAFPLALALVADGFGVMAAQAEESASGDRNGDGKQRWSTRPRPTNTDLANLEVLFADFESRGLIPAGTPKFALGMSAGGSFSHFLGTVADTTVAPLFPQLRFRAVVAYCADATASGSATVSTTPSAWFMCGAEDNPEVSNAQARANETRLRARDIPTDYAELQPSPLYDERFARIEGIDTATSALMAAELLRAGYVDEAGFVTEDADRIAADVLADPGAFPTIASHPRAAAVRSQIKAMRAEHAMYADFTRRTIDFFERFAG